jgi:hypothetical protein
MIKNLWKPLLFFFLVCMLCTCIDPYIPKLNAFESLLAVDAFLTNENRSYSVKLSRTVPAQNIKPSDVSGALVIIKDGNGNNSQLQQTSPGLYQTDSLYFLGEIGNTYTLYIKTAEGTEYESEPCLMYPVQQIDSVYFVKDQEIINNGSETNQGITILLDSRSGNENKYFRWIYNEWWKFSVPNPKEFDYINESTITKVDQIKQVCWKNNISNEIIIQSDEFSQSQGVEKKPILFIASDKSDRLLIQYSIEVKQLSLSKNEYEFWYRMQQINESGGDIFEKQPFSIASNIHNINNPDEQVLGYFQVSAVNQKRIYITPSSISELNLPAYQYDCESIVIGPDDYAPPGGNATSVTFDNINYWFTLAGYTFVKPVYNPGQVLVKLIFSKSVCANCTIGGSLTKPDFWIDLVSPQKSK